MVERLLKTVNGKKIQLHPNCMYLSWTNEGPTPQYKATWCSYRNIDLSKNKFAVYVKWKDFNNEIMIATDYVGEPYSIDMINIYRNKEYLKSHLQKVIRRSSTSRALKTAWHFLDLDLIDFLRRIAIIAIEDCVPLEGYATIVWFIAAVSKGYVVSDEQICWILGYVHDLAECKHYEQIVHDEKLSTRAIKAKSLSQEGKNLVYSILFRKAYGGMKGDKFMCVSAAQLWSSRYGTSSRFLELLDRPLKFVTPPLEIMQKSEWIVGAIDFHCCQGIVSSMWEKHDQFSETEIRNAIWNCSSSITNKINIGLDLDQRNPQKYASIWKVIKKDYLSYARFILDKNA
jgi:hypothetical protein